MYRCIMVSNPHMGFLVSLFSGNPVTFLYLCQMSCLFNLSYAIYLNFFYSHVISKIDTEFDIGPNSGTEDPKAAIQILCVHLFLETTLFNGIGANPGPCIHHVASNLILHFQSCHVFPFIPKINTSNHQFMRLE